jgi:hypothetical protein
MVKTLLGMADPVTLIILLAAGEASSPAASAMAQGAHDAFAGAVTEIRETQTLPTDADALAAEGQSRPDAVAELLWRDADHRHATLRVHLRQSRRWIERSFTFAASDPAAERGRTLGFAVASILPELTMAAAPTPTSPPTGGAAAPAPAGATAASTPDTPVPPATGTAPAAGGSEPAGAPPTANALTPAPWRASTGTSSPDSGSARRIRGSVENTAPEPADRASRLDPRFAVDLLGVGVSGMARATPTTYGGGGAVEWFAHRRLSLRLGAIARAGSLDPAQAHVSTLAIAAGAVFQALPATLSEPFAVTVRADWLLVREWATHWDGDEPSAVTLSHWVSGADTFLDAGLLLSSQIAAVAGFGLEYVFAPTYIYLRDAYVATLPRFRAVVEGGFQLRF